MDRNRRKRWNELEIRRTAALRDAAQIAHEQALLAAQEPTKAGGATGIPGAVKLAERRRQEAEENRVKIGAYLAGIPAGQPGRIREVKTALNLSANTVKKYVVSTPGYIVKSGLILRCKVST